MSQMTYDERLELFYGVMHDFLRRHSEFDGRPRPEMPAIVRRGADPADDTPPWPGVATVWQLSREEWIAERLEAVRLGAEKPPLRIAG